ARSWAPRRWGWGGRARGRAAVVPRRAPRGRPRLDTSAGRLEFQDYFVRRRCEPVVSRLAYVGAESARAHPAALAALRDPRLRAVVICPSNPFLSIEPMLAIPGLRAAIAACAAPVVPVAPITGGRAVKGPTAKLMAEFGLPVSAEAVARRYRDLLDAYVLDHADAAAGADLGIPVSAAHTLMRSLADREALARAVL